MTSGEPPIERSLRPPHPELTTPSHPPLLPHYASRSRSPHRTCVLHPSLFLLIHIVILLFCFLIAKECVPPNLQGRTAIVTGGALGIGYEVSRAFAKAGARTIMINRKEDQGNLAIEKIKKEVPEAQIEWIHCDLGSLKETKEVFEKLAETEDRLDLVRFSLFSSFLLFFRIPFFIRTDRGIHVLARSVCGSQRQSTRARRRPDRPTLRCQLARSLLRHQLVVSSNPEDVQDPRRACSSNRL